MTSEAPTTATTSARRCGFSIILLILFCWHMIDNSTRSLTIFHPAYSDINSSIKESLDETNASKQQQQQQPLLLPSKQLVVDVPNPPEGNEQKSRQAVGKRISEDPKAAAAAGDGTKLSSSIESGTVVVPLVESVVVPDDHHHQQQRQQSTTQTTTTVITSPTPPSSLTTTVEDEDTDSFNPNLTMEDYYDRYELQKQDATTTTIPSKEWLTSCAASLSNDTNIQKPFKVLRPMYRLGDCIKLCEYCVGRKMWIKAKQSGNYTSNMSVMYKRLACGEDKGPYHIGSLENFTVLDEIFEEFGSRPGFVKPDPDVLVIHLRLGDVIDNTLLSVEEFLTDGGIGAHPESQVNGIKSIHSIYTYLDILHKLNNNDDNKTTMTTKKIHIVGGSHKDFKYQKSKVYAHCLQRGLAKAGYEVEMWIEGRDPDQDFYFMSHAKKLMISAGGFSRMIGHMVERKGGQLVGSNDMMNLKHIPGKPTTSPV